MIEDVQLENVTLFREFTWDDLSNVNLVIGENDTGKSNLLRMLYAVSRSFQNLFGGLSTAAPRALVHCVYSAATSWISCKMASALEI